MSRNSPQVVEHFDYMITIVYMALHTFYQQIIAHHPVSLKISTGIFLCYKTLFAFSGDQSKNQRINGPVNAHLRSAAYTCTNKHVLI